MRINKKRATSILYSSIIILLTTVVVFAYKSTVNVEKENKKNSLEPLASKNVNNKTTEKKSPEVTISAVGDCTIGHDDKFAFQNSLPYQLKIHNGDYSYFFKNVVQIFKNDDLTTVNLETTFTNSKQKADKQFTFKAPPEYVKVLSSGSIEAVNLSNNHIYDYLTKGFEDTKNTLKSENINYFGEGNKWTTEIKGVKLGFLGYKGFWYDDAFLKKLKNDISELKSQGYIVTINFHWGEENAYSPNKVQKDLAHFSIDNGADLIIGHHPHVIQGVENYSGKMIFYSLGNFCFGGNTSPRDKDSFILQTKFKTENGKLISYGIKVIPTRISSVTYINNYCPTPMEGDEKTRLLSKLNKLSPNAGFKITNEFTYFNLKNSEKVK